MFGLYCQALPRLAEGLLLLCSWWGVASWIPTTNLQIISLSWNEWCLLTTFGNFCLNDSNVFLLPWKKISLENWKQFLLKLISTYFTSSWACSTDWIKNSKAKTPPSLLHTWHRYRLSMSGPAPALQVARLGTGLKLAIDSIPNCSPASFLSGGKTWSF